MLEFEPSRLDVACIRYVGKKQWSDFEGSLYFRESYVSAKFTCFKEP